MIRRAAVLLLCAVLAALCLLPACAPAEEEQKVVRVGWYDTPFNYKDSFGRRTGYAYEYQRKIAAYTGWKYQYVEGNWPELLQMLRDGKIDMMSDVSYSEERARDYLYASLPMGTESYYLFVSADNQDITSKNLSSLNGKRVGLVEGSIMKDLFLEWEKFHGINAQIVELNCSDEDTLKELGKSTFPNKSQ